MTYRATIPRIHLRTIAVLLTVSTMTAANARVARAGDTIHHGITVSRVAAEPHLVPGVEMAYGVPGESKTILRPADLFVEIESLLGSEVQGDIRDIQPPLVARSRYAKYYLWAVIGLGVFVAAIICGIVYRRRLSQARLCGPPPVPAHELAYAELEQLLQLDLVAAGRVKEFYYRLSDIVRHYLENRFGLMAPERTTEEFLVEMAGTNLLLPEHKGLVGQFLDQCDLVKYAKYGPSDREIKSSYDSAVRLIDETRGAGDAELAGREA